jgi:MSHA biogenesis protein MshM
VRHRLAQAGYNGHELFSSGALKLLARTSGGIPRLLNVLAHKALIAAWGEGNQHIERQHIRQAARDTESARPLGWLGRWV